MLTQEQKRRVANFVPGFYRWYREGTLAYCRKLWSAGMQTEAAEVGEEFGITASDIQLSIKEYNS